MKFLMMWHPAQASTAPPPAALMAEMDELMSDMAASGVLVMAGGMGPLAARVKVTNGQVNVTDGPFTEAKEMIGGYCIVEAQSAADALAMSQRFYDIHAAHGLDGESEVRQLMTPEDYQSE